MSIAYFCVFIAIFLPLVFAGMAKSAGQFDNAQPRVWLANLSGWQQRANWAQQNTFEAFPAFAAGVIIAHQLGGAQIWLDALAVAFLLFRVAFGAAYIADKPVPRTWAWVGGFACTIGMYVVAITAG